MEISFLPPDLRRWASGAGDLLAVCVWSDVRPIRGAAGLLDWRLGGRLSSWISAGRFGGAAGEQTLVPAGRRVPWRSILVLGLGPSSAFGENEVRGVIRRVLGVMRGLGHRRVTLAVPGRESDRISARRAMEIVLDETAKAPVEEMVLIDTPAAQKEMSEVLRVRRQKPPVAGSAAPGGRAPAGVRGREPRPHKVDG